jgi:hypothetical protein
VVPPKMGKNRAQLLSYVMDADQEKYVYVNGLRASIA